MKTATPVELRRGSGKRALVPPAVSCPTLSRPGPGRKIWAHPAGGIPSLAVTTSAAAAAWAALRTVVPVMLATLGSGAVRPNHARRSVGCGKPPDVIAAGRVAYPVSV